MAKNRNKNNKAKAKEKLHIYLVMSFGIIPCQWDSGTKVVIVVQSRRMIDYLLDSCNLRVQVMISIERCLIGQLEIWKLVTARVIYVIYSKLVCSVILMHGINHPERHDTHHRHH